MVYVFRYPIDCSYWGSFRGVCWWCSVSSSRILHEKVIYNDNDNDNE